MSGNQIETIPDELLDLYRLGTRSLLLSFWSYIAHLVVQRI
jgi:hypothetical protein